MTFFVRGSGRIGRGKKRGGSGNDSDSDSIDNDIHTISTPCRHLLLHRHLLLLPRRTATAISLLILISPFLLTDVKRVISMNRIIRDKIQPKCWSMMAMPSISRKMVNAARERYTHINSRSSSYSSTTTSTTRRRASHQYAHALSFSSSSSSSSTRRPTRANTVAAGHTQSFSWLLYPGQLSRQPIMKKPYDRRRGFGTAQLSHHHHHHHHHTHDRQWLPTARRSIHSRRAGPMYSFSDDASSTSNNNIDNRSKKNHQWDVGDYVIVPVEGPGVVTEIRGSGWYSIELIDNASNSDAANLERRGIFVKCRGNRLFPLKTQGQSPKADDDGNTVRRLTSRKIDSKAPDSSVSTSETTKTAEMLVDPGVAPIVPPPPPMIHDLDALIEQLIDDPPTGSSRHSHKQEKAFLQQLIHHSSYDKWVVFTDLHCSSATLDTCLQVLDVVHTAAVQRDAGVLFLGDFWHHRGTLRVDCLNAILDAFKSWTVPLVMIPGNHDQVTLGGHSHGLTPLENAFRVAVTSSMTTDMNIAADIKTDNNNNNNIGDDTTVAGPLVLSHPTVFRKALLIPHVRDLSTMEAVLQSPQAKEVSALLVHAEVKGALMNDLIVSTHGIPPASFPPYKRIYSGHFHKPHFVKAADDRVSIEYLGSPYQVSMAEAEQSKHLAVLDASRGWECVERIPLDLGKKHFRISSVDDLLLFEVGKGVGDKRGPTDQHVNLGDRIVLTVPKEQRLFYSPVDESSDDTSNDNVTKAFKHIQYLRDQGVMVEVREIENVSDTVSTQPGGKLKGTDSDVEGLTPESVWRNYVREEINENADPKYHESILQDGLEILSELEPSSDAQEAQISWGTNGENVYRDLTLSRISIQGFGPFRQQVTYPLLKRGLVLLRGTNNDVGADSNGSGKTSLAMATLWVLTGSLDARKSQDGKVADVVNDDSKTARVTLEGTLNGRPFTLSRTKTATKGELLFHFDGRDLTTLSVKETQALIEETLGINSNLLSRTMFHGQHGMNDLLEATDAKLKEELSLVVPLVTWQLASTAARSKSRHARKKGDEISGMIQLRKDDVRQASDRLREAMELQQEKGKRYNEAKKKTTEELNEIERRLESTIDQDVSELQAELILISATIENMESRYRSLLSEQKTALSPLEMQWKDDEEALQNSKSILFKAEQALVSSTMQLDAARAAASRLEQKWSVDLSDGATPKAFVPPEVCPTCHQPIFEDGDKGSHHAIELTMSTEIEYALSALDKAEQHRKTILQHLLDAEESNRMCQESVNASRKEIEKMSIEWASEVSGWEENIKKEKRRQSELTTQVSTVLERSQLASRRDALIADLQMAQSAMEYSDETYRRLADQVSDAEELLKNLESRKRGYAATERVASELAERFGQRGVQTYVLQNAVDSLEALAQTYLDQLSDGGIRLELSLEAGDKITRRAFVLGSDGKFRERPLSTLSGGQWRRCSLALTVGFAELVARRGRLRSSICVLDEPLTHLDRSGRDKFGAVVRGMLRQNQSSNTEHASSSSSTSLSSDQNRVSGFGMSTIIMILQDLAAEELEEEFDCIDTVVRENGQSFVLVDSE